MDEPHIELDQNFLEMKKQLADQMSKNMENQGNYGPNGFPPGGQGGMSGQGGQGYMGGQGGQGNMGGMGGQGGFGNNGGYGNQGGFGDQGNNHPHKQNNQ